MAIAAVHRRRAVDLGACNEAAAVTQGRALFLDRDGLINLDHGHIHRSHQFELAGDLGVRWRGRALRLPARSPFGHTCTIQCLNLAALSAITLARATTTR